MELLEKYTLLCVRIVYAATRMGEEGTIGGSFSFLLNASDGGHLGDGAIGGKNILGKAFYKVLTPIMFIPLSPFLELSSGKR